MPREKKTFRREDVEAVWKVISALAAEIRQFADQLKDEGYDEGLVVDAGDTMRAGLDNIATWLSKCEQEFRTQRNAKAVTKPQEGKRLRK